MTIEKSNIFEISKELSGQRLDNYLVKNLKGLPKSLIYKLIRSGQVRVNGGRKKVSYRIAENDSIRIPPYLLKDNLISSKILQDPDLYIHFENEEFIIFDKPYGISVHSGSNQEVDLLSSVKASRNNTDLSLVNRLDKNTSGLLIVAKNYQASSCLGKAQMKRDIKKKYYALLVGNLDKDIIEIESKIDKDIKDKKMIINNSSGLEAYTKITLICQYETHCLVDIEIETGRTHQIRIHTSSIGHPIAGDDKYNSIDNKKMNKKIQLKRLFLHAYHLSFYYNQKYQFILDLPHDLKEVLSNLEDNNGRK